MALENGRARMQAEFQGITLRFKLELNEPRYCRQATVPVLLFPAASAIGCHGWHPAVLDVWLVNCLIGLGQAASPVLDLLLAHAAVLVALAHVLDFSLAVVHDLGIDRIADCFSCLSQRRSLMIRDCISLAIQLPAPVVESHADAALIEERWGSLTHFCRHVLIVKQVRV